MWEKIKYFIKDHGYAVAIVTTIFIAGCAFAACSIGGAA